VSVKVLYCEGESKSLDIRVLSTLLPRTCVVKAVGSKRIIPQRVLGAREANQSALKVAGIKDRDFDASASAPTHQPHNWYVTDHQKKVQIGWYWERKEIENYLIDPTVVKRALGSKAPPLTEYRTALQTSAHLIADYTAARIALSLARIQIVPLNNFWGEEREKAYHFPKNKGLKGENCRNQIRNLIKHYEQNLIMPELKVVNQFEELRQDCQAGGCRYQHFLTYFSGKDLLYGMRDQLRKFDFSSPVVFRGQIIKGIEESEEPVWTWLPEWQRFRDIIVGTDSH